jgi:hypothetical protein
VQVVGGGAAGVVRDVRSSELTAGGQRSGDLTQRTSISAPVHCWRRLARGLGGRGTSFSQLDHVECCLLSLAQPDLPPSHSGLLTVIPERRSHFDGSSWYGSHAPREVVLDLVDLFHSSDSSRDPWRSVLDLSLSVTKHTL